MSSSIEGASHVRMLLGSLGQGHVPVVAGAHTPLGPFRNIADVSPGAAQYMRGVRNGLASPELPWRGERFECAAEDGAADADAAARALIDATDRFGPCTLLTLGPLSNIALAERIRPGWLGNLSSLVVMGGSLRSPGDAPGGAEWNFYLDSQAAHEVLAAAPPSTLLVPTDVANDRAFDAAAREALLGAFADGSTHPVSQACRALLRIDPGAGRYDPLAAACLVAPESLLSMNGAAPRLAVSSDASSGVLREVVGGRSLGVVTSIDIPAYHRVLREGLVETEDEFDRFARFIKSEQEAIVSSLEASDGVAAFTCDAWRREDGSGEGRMCVLEDGAAWEKAGVGVSISSGELTDARAKAMSARGRPVSPGTRYKVLE